ncbi:MAG TPA: peptidoglycan DD-metalloendopeptidase family protein [Gaiellaceae bacterium]
MRLRRLLLIAAVVLLGALVTRASGDDYSRKHAIDARLQSVQARLAWAEHRQRELSAQLDSVDERLRALSARVGDVSARLVTIEHDLALHQEKLDKLTELYKVETARFLSLKRQYAISVERLDQRLVELYEGGEPSTLEVLLSSRNFSDLISSTEYVDSLRVQDARIAGQILPVRKEARAQRLRTQQFRAVVAAETRTIRVRTEQVRSVERTLFLQKHELASARSSRRESLIQVNESKREFLHEAAGLSAASAALAARIQSSSGYSPPDSTPSAAGLIWPVSGPVTSPFGMRWGRMHTGIDIGVPYGTSIHAAASGRVVHAGWMDGYGNLVAIDHGRGLSTAYAHQSRIGVSLEETVGQGQVIGYVGCTGHCFGPHLHFEVRINGTPVDPMGYL